MHWLNYFTKRAPSAACGSGSLVRPPTAVCTVCCLGAPGAQTFVLPTGTVTSEQQLGPSIYTAESNPGPRTMPMISAELFQRAHDAGTA